MTKVSVTRDSILGIDIGSVSLSIVQMDPEGNIQRQFCQFHKGNIRDTFSEAEEIFDLPGRFYLGHAPFYPLG